MIDAEARDIVERVLAPVPLEQFFDGFDRAPWSVAGGPDHARARLFGAEPTRTVLDAHATHAARIGWHAEGASGPPPGVAPAASPAEFLASIRAFHDRGYTVHVPDAIQLSAPLALFARALEHLLHQPVKASLFWSRAGARAPVHYDRRENIVVQLAGRKRWFVSTDPPGIQNEWRGIAEGAPRLDRAHELELGPGDLLYVPRGTPHRVESLTDSLHLSMGFLPLTVREAIIALLDHVSDGERSLRETALRRPTATGGPAADEGLGGLIRDGLARLGEAARSPAVIEQAMQRRSSRVVGALRRPPSEPAPVPLSPGLLVEHVPLATCHLIATGGSVDLSLPGGPVYVHAAAAKGLAFVAATARFRIADIPGPLTDELRIALVQRLIDSGFLRVARVGERRAA